MLELKEASKGLPFWLMIMTFTRGLKQKTSRRDTLRSKHLWNRKKVNTSLIVRAKMDAHQWVEQTKSDYFIWHSLEFCTVGKDEDWRDQSCVSQTIHCRESWGCAFLRLGLGNRERREERRERCVCTWESVCARVWERVKEGDWFKATIYGQFWFWLLCDCFVNLQVSISKLKRFYRVHQTLKCSRHFVWVFLSAKILSWLLL